MHLCLKNDLEMPNVLGVRALRAFWAGYGCLGLQFSTGSRLESTAQLSRLSSGGWCVTRTPYDRVDKALLGLGPGVPANNQGCLKGTWPPKFLAENNSLPNPYLPLFTLQHSSVIFIMARPKKAEEKPKDSGSLQISVEDFVRTRNSVSFHLSPPPHPWLCRDSTRSFSSTTSSRLPTTAVSHTFHFHYFTMSATTPHKVLMTHDQRDEALQAVHLLTLPCQNVCDIAYALVHNIMCGAMNPEQGQLTIAPKVVTGLATLQSAVSDLSRAYIAHTDTVIGKGNASSLEQLNLSNPLSGENGLFGGRGPTPAPTTEAAPEGKKRKRAPHDKNAPKRALTPFFLYLQTARPALAAEMGSGHTAKEVQDEGGRRWREMTDKDKSVN